MATITEDYVSFEIAKLLKSKKFHVPTRSHYDSLGGFGFSDICEIDWNNYKCFRERQCYSAPTLQMAMKWLREAHNIDIVIDAAVGMLGVKVYVPFISTYKPRKDNPSKVRQIKRGVYYKDDKGIIQALQYFDTYEEACEVAIKYCLENLI